MHLIILRDVFSTGKVFYVVIHTGLHQRWLLFLWMFGGLCFMLSLIPTSFNILLLPFVDTSVSDGITS
jgi:hypothetical protein